MSEQLLQLLRSRANARGLILARAAALQEQLRFTYEALQLAIERLAERGVIDILTPGRYLVLAIRRSSWSGEEPKPQEVGPETGPLEDPVYSYSSLSQSKLSKHVKESYRQGPADEALLQEILATLGESDPTTFRGALRSYSPEVIRTALRRVRSMKQIKKSPTALFRFLLPRIAQEPGFKK